MKVLSSWLRSYLPDLAGLAVSDRELAERADPAGHRGRGHLRSWTGQRLAL